MSIVEAESESTEEVQDQNKRDPEQDRELVELKRLIHPGRPLIRAYLDETKFFDNIEHRRQYEDGKYIHFFYSYPVKYAEGRFFIESKGAIPNQLKSLITDFSIKVKAIPGNVPPGIYKAAEATALVVVWDNLLYITITATDIDAAYKLYFDLADGKLFPLEVCGESEAEQKQKAAEMMAENNTIRVKVENLQSQLREKEEDRENAHSRIVIQLKQIDDLEKELAELRQKLVPWYRKALTFLQRLVNVRA